MRRKTHDEFVREVYELHGDKYTILSGYINQRADVKVRHNNDKCNNFEYDVKAQSIINGNGCPKCYGKNKLNNTEFKNRVYNLVGDEYEFLDEYITYHKKIKVKHNSIECNNNEYIVSPAKFFSGRRCIVCSRLTMGRQKKSNDEFLQEVKRISGDEYKFLEEYAGIEEKIRVRHNCEACSNHEYKVSPNKFLNGRRCPICNSPEKIGKMNKKTNERFVEEMTSLFGDEYTPVEEYEYSHKKIKIKHSICGNTYEIVPSIFLGGTGMCSYCYSSRGEKAISDFLNKVSINYKTQYRDSKCRDKQPLPFDFAVMKSGSNIPCLLIEYDGEQHFNAIDMWGGEHALKKQSERDGIKNGFCIKNNIPLLRIPYWKLGDIDEILFDELVELGILEEVLI